LVAGQGKEKKEGGPRHPSVSLHISTRMARKKEGEKEEGGFVFTLLPHKVRIDNTMLQSSSGQKRGGKKKRKKKKGEMDMR